MIGFWLLAFSCWLLAVGYWLLELILIYLFKGTSNNYFASRYSEFFIDDENF